MRKLGLSLLLFLCLLGPSLAEPLTEVERLSRIFADGARVTRDFKPPMSWLERCPQPGAMICPDGLIVSLRNGYLMTSWDSVQSVVRLPDAMVITLGHPELSSTYRIPTLVAEPSERLEHPSLREPEEFVQALVQSSGLENSPEERTFYARGKQRSRPPTEARVFEMEPATRGPGGWAREAIARLASQPAITLSEHGIAVVGPNEVLTVRWDEAKGASAELGSLDRWFQAAHLRFERIPGDWTSELLTLESPNANGYYPGASDFFTILEQLKSQLRPDGGFEPMLETRTFPLFCGRPDWVTGFIPEEFSPPEKEPVPQGLALWPNRLKAAGLYLLPEGLLVAKRYWIQPIAWRDLSELQAHPYGYFREIEENWATAPDTLEDVAAFRAARAEAILAAGLKPTGRDFPSYKREGELLGPSPSAHGYALSIRAGWRGLSPSLLGEKPWSDGLYLLPEGLVSVEPHRLSLIPWRELNQIRFGWEPDRAVLELLVQGEDGVVQLPQKGGPELKGVDAQALREALEGYLKIEGEGKVTVRPEAERQRRVEFPYHSFQRYRSEYE